MGLFDKINNRIIVSTLKQLLQARYEEMSFLYLSLTAVRHEHILDTDSILSIAQIFQ